MFLRWLVTLVVVTLWSCANPSTPPSVGEYEPDIRPAEFTSRITHPLFPYAQGSKWTYAEGASGRVEIEVLKDERIIMGVACTSVHDVAFVEGAVEEDTIDWYAQDAAGNVWYFGEDTKELDLHGNVVSTKGSWVAGERGAKPGIIMPANAAVGDVWREEYLPGEAEDQAKALNLNAGIKVGAGNFTGCLKTFNFTPLEMTSNEMKVYCPGVGPVWTIDLASDEVEELISYLP